MDRLVNLEIVIQEYFEYEYYLHLIHRIKKNNCKKNSIHHRGMVTYFYEKKKFNYYNS
jgi:hypothetical protein